MEAGRPFNLMNILIPIETLARELDYKLVLSYEFLRKTKQSDVNIYIGSVNIIHNLLSDFQGGIYFGKTIFSSKSKKLNLKRYQEIKEYGFNLLYLHEEGAIWYGEEEDWRQHLKHQYDISILDKQDKVCVWGSIQKSLELDRNINQVPIYVTGHPKFDLARDFSGLYKNNVDRPCQRLGTFVLINGNFGGFNHAAGFERVFKYCERTDLPFEEAFTQFMNKYTSIGQRMHRMVELTIIAAKRFKNVNFVFRPHPSENLNAYHDFFSSVPNIIVEFDGSVMPYILAAKMIVHDGCTTAIEAGIARKPVLNYKRINDEFDIFLPNQIGESKSDTAAAIQFIEKVLQGDILDRIDLSVESTKAKELLHNLDDEDSLSRVIDLLEEQMSNLPLKSLKSPSISKIRFWYLKFQIRLKLSFAKNKLLGQGGKLKKDQYLRQKFGGFDYPELRNALNSLKEKNDSNIKMNLLCPELILITNK